MRNERERRDGRDGREHRVMHEPMFELSLVPPFPTVSRVSLGYKEGAAAPGLAEPGLPWR